MGRYGQVKSLGFDDLHTIGRTMGYISFQDDVHLSMGIEISLVSSYLMTTL